MELTDSLKALFIDTAQRLKGSARRQVMARTVQELGPGGQRRAEREWGWGRPTIRKGHHELASGISGLDAFNARGRKRAEEHRPHLLTDITALVDSQSQTDPQLRTNRLYTRRSAAEVRRQLILQKGYTEEQVPTVRTIGDKLNALNYHPTRVAKTQPQQRSLRPMPSSTRSRASTRRPRRTRPACGCRWTLKRRSRSVPSAGGAPAGSPSRPPIMTARLRRR